MSDAEAIAAQTLLDQKVRETITKSGGTGLGAVLVSNSGDRTIDSAQGTRRLGASGAAAKIQPQDKWCLGSVSKPLTGTTVAVLIQKQLGNLTWLTPLKEVFPDVLSTPGAWPQYADVTIEQLMAHTSGLGWNANTEPDASTPGGGWFPSPATLGLNDDSVMQRRRRFVHAYILDKPLFAAGQGVQYGGGTIIVAAMFEARTGIRFERLIKTHVYDPLGMSNSGWGITSPGALDGPWHHRWDKNSRALVPDEGTHTLPYNFNSHAVDGALTTSAADMGAFIKENLRPDPTILSLATRDSVQSNLPAAGLSSFTRGAWACQDTANPATADLRHNGDDGTSYADVQLHRSKNWGSAAFSNANSQIGQCGVNDLQNTMQTMMLNWNALFASSPGPFWEAVHPGPGLAQAPNGNLLFTRRHTGALVRRILPLAGAPEVPKEFPGAIFTSGIAAASTADGKHVQVVARGTDNRIWRGSSTDAGATWGVFEPILSKTFATGPAIAVSAVDGMTHVFAVGADLLMYRTRSVNGGAWDAWTAIGAGTFTSQPAAACSHDAKTVHVFARGQDHRIWRNLTKTGGASWEPHWVPVGDGIFTTGPAAVCDKTAATVHVTGRGPSGSLWHNLSFDTGAGFLPRWNEIPNGTFTSSSAMTARSTATIDVVALGGDFCAYKNTTANAGIQWAGWKKIGQEFYL